MEALLSTITVMNLADLTTLVLLLLPGLLLSVLVMVTFAAGG
jgi:hypothetical protein